MRLAWGATPGQSTEFGQTWSFRGTKSRNKVSVGEPAEGSLQRYNVEVEAGGRGALKGAGAAEHCSYGDMCLRGCSCLCFPALQHTHCGVFYDSFCFSLGLFPGRRHKQDMWRRRYTRSTNTTIKTFNNGSLGSRIDEERSELRYVMRIAASVKHRIFERTLRPPVFQGACLSERRFLSQRLCWLWAAPVWQRTGQPESADGGGASSRSLRRHTHLAWVTPGQAGRCRS